MESMEQFVAVANHDWKKPPVVGFWRFTLKIHSYPPTDFCSSPSSPIAARKNGFSPSTNPVPGSKRLKGTFYAKFSTKQDEIDTL